jgi:hypothetical protein
MPSHSSSFTGGPLTGQELSHTTSSTIPLSLGHRPPIFNAPKRPPPRQVTQPVDLENRDHAYILANKWLNSGKLAEMSKNEGKSA